MTDKRGCEVRVWHDWLNYACPHPAKVLAFVPGGGTIRDRFIAVCGVHARRYTTTRPLS